MMSATMLRCIDQSKLVAYDDDGLATHTSKEQDKVEQSVLKTFDHMRAAVELCPELPRLLRDQHKRFLRKGLFEPLPPSYQCLDCSKPWLSYWITHSQVILEDETTLAISRPRVCQFLKKCSNKTGGYGGGPSQLSHLAATYASVNALVSLCSEEALASIDRSALRNFLCDLKQPDGSYIMHRDGEVDVRGVYCAISVATLCDIDDPRLYHNTADWVLSCQTYEGGFAGVPGGEAHGGYTFCAVAALVILGAVERCDLRKLLRWLVHRQQSLEGGFAGRTNKLVDGCYSFWQGGLFPLIHAALTKKEPKLAPPNSWLFNRQALQEYILVCCQETKGGLIDKPGRNRDYYHTCYCLSGLSVAQHAPANDTLVVGGQLDENQVIAVHPVFNVSDEAVQFAKSYFSARPLQRA